MKGAFRPYRMVAGVVLALLLSPYGEIDQEVRAYASGKMRVAVVGKIAKGQSARRFDYLFPRLTERFRESFSGDQRFELIPGEEVEAALTRSGIGKGKLDPEDLAVLQRIGKEAGADLVLVSYYYEMGGHAMPMHSNNFLMLVWVDREQAVKVNREYSKILSEAELTSSDEMAWKELMNKADPWF
jgi:hypothetical protein